MCTSETVQPRISGRKYFWRYQYGSKSMQIDVSINTRLVKFAPWKTFMLVQPVMAKEMITLNNRVSCRKQHRKKADSGHYGACTLSSSDFLRFQKIVGTAFHFTICPLLLTYKFPNVSFMSWLPFRAKSRLTSSTSLILNNFKINLSTLYLCGQLIAKKNLLIFWFLGNGSRKSL